MAKVKSGRYQMPPFLPEIQDLISRMLTVDSSKRITLNEIKLHPAFHLFLPKNYEIPEPIPLPVLPDPIDTTDLDEKLYSVLIHLGFQNETEIRAELQANSHNMAKVFTHILTTGFSLESLPWEKDKLSLVKTDAVPSDEFLVDSNDQPQAFTLHSNDSFGHKKAAPMSLGSPDIFSLVEKAPWMGDQDPPEVEFEGNTDIPDITIPLPKLFEAIQQQLSSNQYKYFYPNDVTLFAKFPDEKVFIVIQAKYTTKDTITLSLRHLHGSVLLFSPFVHMIQDIINSFN